jgi:high-affinity iron transporter
MIESLIISLREGIEISLVIGILIVYLRKIQHDHLIRSVFTGLFAAVAASIVCAIVLQKLAIDQEVFEGYLMMSAAVFVLSMIVWMWITANKISSEIKVKVDSIVERSSSWRIYVGIFTFTFLMIVREGIEMVIFLQAVAFSTSAWSSLSGTVAGLTFAAVFGILFVRGSVKIDIGRFLKVTAITLIIFTLQLLVNAFHEFYEYGVFPANPKAMQILGPIVQHDVLFILAIISIPALMLVIPSRRQPAVRGYRRWQLSAGIAALCFVFFLGMGEIYSSDTDMDLSSLWLDTPSDNTFRIPISDVDDGKIHRYSINDDGVEIRFFILRIGLGKFATSFDACYACYSYGKYFLRNGELICSLCDAPSSLMKLKPSGEIPEPDPNNSGSMEGNGCAPIYLPSTIYDGNIVITLNDLQKRRKYFDITPP